MPATPISDPVSGESLVGTEPQLSQQTPPAWWRERLNMFTGRTLSVTALDGEQFYRAGLLATLGQSVTAGVVNGLQLTIDTSGADPQITVTPGYGIGANGQDVVLNSKLKTALSTLPVYNLALGSVGTFHQIVGDPTNTNYAGILLLQPVIVPVSGQVLDTGAPPIEVSGNLGASCNQDPAEYPFEDWQIADGVQLIYIPWPAGVPALPQPPVAPQATWRNRLAYAIFEAEALLGPDDQLPWAMLGVPLALIGFDPGIGWKADTAYSANQFITDSNSNIQLVKTAGTSGNTEPPTTGTGSWSTVFGGTTTDGSVTWVNNGLAWKPLFVDCSAVVRAGGLPRARAVLPSLPPPLLVWQSQASFATGSFIVDSNNNVQLVQTAGKSNNFPPQWNTAFGATTTDGSVVWKNNGPAGWKANTAFASGQFIFDANGNMQHVQTAGTSGPATPDWNGIYLPTTDGTITWINNGTGNPPVVQSATAQARINQLSEQLTQTLIAGESFKTLADIFPTLPPSGILPVTAVNFSKHTAPWLPPNWSVSAAPVHLEELETVLETGILMDPIAAEATAPENATLLEPVELLVPLPDALYDPDILVVETVAPAFTRAVASATSARNLTLQQIKTVQGEMNALNTVIGPDQPLNPNLIDPDNGLTQDELNGRNTPPPYTPSSNETFGTVLQTTWLASTTFAVGQFIIDSNGALQVVTVAGETGTSSPTNWNTTIGETTTDNKVTWMNNGPWAWQPNTAYVAGQFVVDPSGYMQVVTQAGSSASSQPAWTTPEKSGATTTDGIVWQASGKALWQPDFLYAVGQLIFDAAGNIQTVQTGGISGDNVPKWNPTANQTTSDGGVVWQNLGHSTWQKTTAFSTGQAIVDSNSEIQLAIVGGTSGNSAPTWNEAAGQNTLDASVTWGNKGLIAWQPSTQYTAGQTIIDSNGNLQYATVLNANGVAGAFGTQATSGKATPNWNTQQGGSTTDGAITWVYLAYNSLDLLQLKAVAAQYPYTLTFQGSGTTPTTYTISLLSQTDWTNLSTNGLKALVASLHARISAANDLLDTAFLTTQTDIYRYRQNILGASAATTLATSPILANIATGESATAAAQNLQTYIGSVIPQPSTVTPNFTPPTPSFPGVATFTGLSTPVVLTNKTLVEAAAAAPAAPATRMELISRSVATSTTAASAALTSAAIASVPVKTSAASLALKSATGVTTLLNAASLASVARIGTVVLPTTTVSPTTIQVNQSTVSSGDITGQSPLAGAQLNVRTLTIAQRLQQSPSQEAMFYSIANRLSFLQTLQQITEDLNLVVDDLPILMDGTPTNTSTGSSSTTAPTAVPLVRFPFAEWLGADTKLNLNYPNNQTSIIGQIQAPYIAADSSEATLFSVGVRVAEQHTMMLRALENRVQQYSDFLTLCTNALNNIQTDISSAQTYVTQLHNTLLQERQNVAFTEALLADEQQRVAGVNAQRQQVLSTSVQLIAYTRARTLETIDTTPSRQLVPANVTNPVPACLQQSVAIPPELREIVGQLREAPVSWLPAAAAQVWNLERPVLLQQLALSVQSRASLAMQLPALPSSAAGEPGTYAPAVAKIYSTNLQVFRSLTTQRATFQPASLVNLSWSAQVTNIASIAAVNDLIASDAAHTEVSNAVTRLIQQISSVATCLYTRAGLALPIDRLAWAEYLSGNGMNVQLQSLAILPSWNQLSYSDRQQMQMLVDWLFLQIDTSVSAATAFMSDVVRTAILLASDVPVDNIIPSTVISRVQPSIGSIVSLNLTSDRIASGMFVNLYSGATLAARAVVSDLDAATVSAQVTDVYSPGTYLEASDTAHLTTLTPQAIALRPFAALS